MECVLLGSVITGSRFLHIFIHESLAAPVTDTSIITNNLLVMTSRRRILFLNLRTYGVLANSTMKTCFCPYVLF